MPGTDICITGGTVVTPRGIIRNGTVAVKDSRIVAVSRNRQAKTDTNVINAAGGYVVPGFIDTHVHGGAGYDSVAGKFDIKSTGWIRSTEVINETIPAIARYHASHGTTGMVVATTAAPENELRESMKAIGNSAVNGVEAGARIIGAHVEGSFLKTAAYAGAQSPRFFIKPSVAAYRKLQKAAQGNVKIINVAPEYGAAACTMIKAFTADGGVAGIGHAGCSFEQYEAAVDAGARLHIHLGNGPTESSFKVPGRSLEAALTDDRITGELIMDGYHLNPAYILDFLLAKNFNAVGITDCMFAGGTKGIRRFKLGTKAGMVDKGGERLVVYGTRDQLFGSTLTMDRAFRNCVAWLSAGMRGIYHRTPVNFSKDMAIAAAVKLFSGNPAKLLGINRATGSVAAGKRADLVVLDADLNITNVIINGKTIQR